MMKILFYYLFITKDLNPFSLDRKLTDKKTGDAVYAVETMHVAEILLAYLQGK